MSGTMQGAMNVADTADRNAFEEEAIEIASQWAQEKVENFLNDIESNGNDHKLLKISHIISRRTSIDVFTGESSDIGKFAKDLIGKLADSKVMEGLENLIGSLLNKLFGSASGSAQTERIYEVAVDELGELNRLDAFFFCYRFASSGINKAVIGTCIVRSAAIMVDDNAYRVVLGSSATLSDAQRASLVAKYQDPGPVSPTAVYGTRVATSEQFPQRRSAARIFKSGNTGSSAELKAEDLVRKMGRPIESSN